MIRFLLAISFVALTLGLRVNDEQSSLNQAVGAAINELNVAGKLDALFTEYYGIAPIPVPTENCHKVYPDSDLIPQDSDLARVLNSGTLRVAISAVAAGKPIIFSNVGDGLDLTVGTLEGMEVEEARLAAEAIGNHYDESVSVEFVIIPPYVGDVFFGPLRDALENRTADLVWSRMTNTAERAQSLDFTCDNFKSNNVIGTGPGVSTTPPPADGALKVACVAIFCTLDLPAGLVFEEYGSLEDSNNALLTGATPYATGTKEQLALFYQAEDCTTCGFMDGVILGENIWSPSTRRLERPETVHVLVDVAVKHANFLEGRECNEATRKEARAANDAYNYDCRSYPSVSSECMRTINDAFHEVACGGAARPVLLGFLSFLFPLFFAFF